MEIDIISFLGGGLFVGVLSWYLSHIVLRAEVIDMIDEETSKQIKDMEFKLSYLKKRNHILKKQKDIAITDAKEALNERNEAMIMLTKKMSNGT